MEPSRFRRITVEEGAAGSALFKRYPFALPVNEAPQTAYYRDGKRDLHIAGKNGSALHLCASLSDEYICCNVHVLRSMSNCPFDCSYCFLQNYLNNGTTMVVSDIEALVGEVREKISLNPHRFLRIGTWELADSLALEDRLGTAGALVEAFSGIDGAVLELKTKSDNVDSILDLGHKGRTVISWSMNPEAVIKAEEHGTASLERRLAAMHKAAGAGYPVGIHFDPLIYYQGWQEDYGNLVRRIFETVSPDIVPW
ncbi:MAG: hypothetical protein HQK54_14840, partial [Oligoflexales bacterium]|nr:hypothetical protein [Oligoflexales bacterium]